MEKKKVLYINQEITPYLPKTKMSALCRTLPQGIQEKGKEIRAFMPRYGLVNERRNQLHEVIRLSGMNLIINDTDHSLHIKVASIQEARMQVYFIDNENYFQRKFMFHDNENKFFPDNDERAIFYCRGVLETIKKLRWLPDIIHCHGWISALTALYIKTTCVDNPLFKDSKIITSLYNDGFNESFNKDMKTKLLSEGINEEDLELLNEPNYINLMKLSLNYSDGVIKGEDEINPELEEYAKKREIPFLDYKNEDEYIDAYFDFYDKIIQK